MNPSTFVKTVLICGVASTGLLACHSIEDAGSPPSDPFEKWSGETSAAEIALIDSYNDPSALEPDFERGFEQLPLGGRADTTPWTDSYWPKNKGGISYRWQTGESHTYQSPDRDTILSMSETEIARLSPSEKYDLYAGSYDYALTTRIKSENSANESGWTGYCHGWTPASYRFKEPTPIVVTNPDGVRIAFGSSDIKALLTYFQGEVVMDQYSVRGLGIAQPVRTIGSTCSQNDPRLPQCYDTNPGAFHITLANYVGVRKEPFGIDATTTYEKWNHPVYQYSTQVISRGRPDPAVDGVAERVYVQSDVTYALEIEPAWDAKTGTAEYPKKTKQYLYTLDLDDSGQIIGGEWLTRTNGGQFMTLTAATEYLLTMDDNGDGQPDLTVDQVKESIWQYFDFPDYAWNQDVARLPSTFTPVSSKYAIAFATQSSRKALYEYMGLLKTLYEQSTGESCATDPNLCD